MTDKEHASRTWTSILADEIHRHPDLAARDVHKLVMQACLGGDHLLRDRACFAESLAQEWSSLPDCSPRQDVLLQRIHPSGTVARLHLAPCKARGLSLRDVSQLLLAQPLRQGHAYALQWAWATVLHCARIGEIPFAYDDLMRIHPGDEVTHHSVQYGPACYRILNDLRHGSTREWLCRLGILR